MTAGNEYVNSIGGSIGYTNGVRNDKDQKVCFLECNNLILSPKDIRILNESWEDGDEEQINKVKEAGHRITDMCRMQFEAVAAKNTKAKKKYGHIWLSFTREDEEIFERLAKENKTNVESIKIKIAKEYLEELGVTNCQWYMAEHKDTAQPHVHISYNRIRQDGSCIDLGPYKAKSVGICARLNKKYGLTPPGVSKGQNVKKSPKETTKHLLLYILKQAKRNCKNFDELEEFLRGKHVEMKIYRHSETNEAYGLSFNCGENASYKASDLPAEYHFLAIKEALERNASIAEKKAKQIKESPKTEQKIETTVKKASVTTTTSKGGSSPAPTFVPTGKTVRDNKSAAHTGDGLDETEEVVDENGNKVVKKKRDKGIKI